MSLRGVPISSERRGNLIDCFAIARNDRKIFTSTLPKEQLQSFLCGEKSYDEKDASRFVFAGCF